MKPNEEPPILACAKADSPFTIPGSVFDKCCAKCGQRVQIAPLGQKRLAKEVLEIRCSDCLFSDPGFWLGEYRHERTGPDEQFERELDSEVPNTWRQRN